ncbi:MAG: ATP-dependent DNA ligase [Myxococcales bacterium]
MALPLAPPVAPMLSRLEGELPRGPGWLYEPKWDGFRAIVFRQADQARIQSRNGQWLDRYFPELLGPLVDALPEGVFDGEIVIEAERGLDFPALLQRIHPARSRVERLARETPASFAVFDLLAKGSHDVRDEPLSARRAQLEGILRKRQGRVFATPQTDQVEVAQRWYRELEAAGIEGVVAKRAEAPYASGQRAMVKVKHARTADCVVGGFRPYASGAGVGSLLLGSFDAGGELAYLGHELGAERGAATRRDGAPAAVGPREESVPGRPQPRRPKPLVAGPGARLDRRRPEARLRSGLRHPDERPVPPRGPLRPLAGRQAARRVPRTGPVTPRSGSRAYTWLHPRRRERRMRTNLLFFALMVLGASCDCGGGVDGTRDVGHGATGDGAVLVNGDGGSGGNTDGGSGTVDSGTASNVEVCDGFDNDFNGIIDDVDVAGDGICDCLKIATLGYPGQWGNGDVFNSWLNGKSLDGAVSLGGQVLTADLLEPYQVIVIQDVRVGTAGQEGKGKGIGRRYSTAERDALKAWVEAGGGVMTLIGYSDSSEIENVNVLLGAFGLAYGNTQILPKSGGSTVPVTHWATHPTTEGLQKVGVDNGYPVTGGTLVAWQPDQGAWDVARVATPGKGHVFVWCDEWITYDSEWESHADYQVERFWLNVIKWITAEGVCQVTLPPIN